ncbi:MAG: hypothetical protein C0410_08305 [Anaerolinea sp.]|nr:hypothetical protein [Anaerolinea sp.]
MKPKKGIKTTDQNEETLKESELLFGEIFTNVPDPLFLLEVTNDGNFRNLEVNPAFESSVGISRASLVGKLIEDSVPEETANTVIAKYRHCVDSGRVIEEEAVLDLAVGRRFFNSTLIPIIDNTGRVYRILGITRDITAHKEAELLLEEEINRRRILFEKNQDGIIVLNEMQEVMEANQQFINMLGYTQEELFHLHPWDWDQNTLTHDEFVGYYFISQIKDNPIESCLRHKDGKIIFVEARVILSETQNYNQTQIVYSDVTLRKLQDEQLTKQARRLAIINQVAGMLNRSLELNTILQVIVDSLAESLKLDQVGLALFDESRQRLTVVSDHQSTGMPSTVGTDLSLQDNLSMEYILRTKTSLLVQNAQQDPLLKAVQNNMVQLGIFSILLVPLVLQDEVIGTIGCDITEPNRSFTPEEVELAETITNLATIRIQQARLYSVEHQRATDLSLLQATAMDISMIKDFSSSIKTIIERAVWLMDASGGSFFLSDPQRRTLECKVSVNFPYEPSGVIQNYGQGAVGKVAITGKAMVIQDYSQWPERILPDEAISSPFALLTVPVKWQNQITGVIQLCRTNLRNPFIQREIDLLSLFSDQVAISLENNRLYQELQQVAIRDSLTGLLNRRGLQEMGLREIDRCCRYKRSISALMIDIDHFKSINDNYGHLAGDQALVSLAIFCKEKMRSIDLVCRLGGDEFLVLLPESNLETTRILAKRLCVAISESYIETNIGNLRITVSIGVAELNNSMTELEDLIQAADKALYLAKQSGRNQVQCYQET